jgi:hypothetical protein
MVDRLDGVGLAFMSDELAALHLASGALVRVLEDWCPPFPGFFLYYPSRRQQPAALSALIERFVCRESYGPSGPSGCRRSMGWMTPSESRSRNELRIAKLLSFRPRGGLIAPAVENSGDQNVPVVSIVDDVILDGERSNTLAELLPEATHPRLFG